MKKLVRVKIHQYRKQIMQRSIKVGDKMKRLIFRLYVSLIIFTIIIIVANSIYNQRMILKDMNTELQEKWNLVEGHILSDMQTVDNAQLYFDATYSEEMERELLTLREYYDSNPDIYSWNVAEIRERTGMDFYIINNQNKIVVATDPETINFDFNECCGEFVELLDKRRMNKNFYTNSFEHSVFTNKLSKYSYLATNDHQYILGLGGHLQDLPHFQEFDFYNSIDNLIKKYDDILYLCVINDEGHIFEWHGDFESIEEFPDNLRQAYNTALKTNTPTEIKEKVDYKSVLTNRFVPYEAQFPDGQVKKRVIYFQYNNDLEQTLLKRNTERMFAALAFGILLACFMLAIIIKILLTTLRRANYDTLTGLYNRASYLDYMEKALHRTSLNPVGLLLIDLDNFKYINDKYGHIAGDEVLKDLAEVLKPIALPHYSVRFGGDEFAIIISRASEEKLSHYAETILEATRKKQEHSKYWKHLSLSIGGAFKQQDNETEVSLFMRADKALYISKHEGKGRYTFNAIVK